MKIRSKSMALIILVAIWPLLSYAQEPSPTPFENLAGREGYRQLQLQTDGRVPVDGVSNAMAWVNDHMVFDPDAWREFLGSGGTFDYLGPGNIGGRIRSIIIKPVDPIHPTDPRTIWLGAVEGGIWKSTNGGTTWNTNTDLLASLAVNCMAIDPTNPDVLYAGTGEGYGNVDAAPGNGIFKSNDGGTTWAQLPATSNATSAKKFAWVNRIAIDPTNPQILLAATRVYPPLGGAPYGLVQRSTNGGQTWLAVLNSPASIVNVSFKPRSQGMSVIQDTPAVNCLATSEKGHLYYSINGGATWTENSNFPPPTYLQRLEVAYSRSNPNIVYALKAGVPERGEELYRSVNEGFSFTLMGKPNDRSAPDGGGAPGATWYTNTLWVDPTDPNKLIAAGVSSVRSTDGGQTWKQTGNGHLDHHRYVEDPGFDATVNSIVYDVNDGGIFRTPDIWAQCAPGISCVEWGSLNHGLGVTQFYGAAGHSLTGTIVGGAQDNGTVVFEGDSEAWRNMAYGDGGNCAVDQTADPRYYGEYVNGQVFRSSGRNYGEPIWFGILPQCGGTPCANFIAPLVLDPNPNGENRLLLGGQYLWRTNNARAAYPSWYRIKDSLPTGDYINTIAMANGQPGTVWVGYNGGEVFYSQNGTAETPSWLSPDPNHSLPLGRASNRIVLGPDVYATFGGFFPSTLDLKGNVWKRDANGTWSDISNNLPSCPVYALAVSPTNPNTLYVGTEVGMFASANGGATWSPGISGLPAIPGLEYGSPINTRVVDMFWMIRGTDRQLVIATHGRGMLLLHAVQ